MNQLLRITPADFYCDPVVVENPSDCFFYHKIDLPTYGTLGGDWDHRGDVDGYIGNYACRGKRVLDVGAAGGFFSFEMEKRGAEVVSFDIRDGRDWNIVPHYKLADQMEDMRRKASHAISRLKNAYWLAHRDLNSSAKAYYGDIYNLPPALGTFDMVFYGMILTHLRDPFEALAQGARLCRETMIVTGIWSSLSNGQCVFRPHPEKSGNLDVKSWWLLSESAVTQMLGVLGFEVVKIIDSKAIVSSKDTTVDERKCRALVAKRKRPLK